MILDFYYSVVKSSQLVGLQHVINLFNENYAFFLGKKLMSKLTNRENLSFTHAATRGALHHTFAQICFSMNFISEDAPHE